MTENYICSIHIEKLGHQIKEIRERALFSIISKLNRGFLYDNDLARSKELLEKLLNWFSLQPLIHEETVLKLIERILKSEKGKLLVTYYYTQIIENLEKVRSKNAKFAKQIDEIIYLVQNRRDEPQFESVTNIALTNEESCNTNSETSTNNFTLPWQFLVETDKYVLNSFDNSLRNYDEPSTLIHSCNFFNNILLHDFPAEIFLQRPSIILTFHELLFTNSKAITNSIINCLINFTKTLQVRLNCYNEPHLRNFKKDTNFSVSASNQTNGWEMTENSVLLKEKQLTLNGFIVKLYKAVFKFLQIKNESLRDNKQRNQFGVNLSLILLQENLNLAKLIINKRYFTEDLVKILTGYGEILQYYKLETISDETNFSYRVVHLILLHNCMDFLQTFVPVKFSEQLPKILKISLLDSLIDINFARLYPKCYDVLLEYTEDFKVGNDLESLKNFKKIQEICTSITAFFQFMKNDNKNGLELTEKALPCLDFYNDLNFVRKYVEMCLKIKHSDDLQKSEDVTLKLLAHNCCKVKEEMFRLCHKSVITVLGPKLKSVLSESQIRFLVRPKILIEIALFGVNSDNIQIKKYSEEIIIYLIKCKILVNEKMWNLILQALLIALPVLLAYCDINTSLGRNLLNFLDPDTGSTLLIPIIEIFKGNIILLFKDDLEIKIEALNRLCWLLTNEENFKYLLPRLNNSHDLLNVFQVEKSFDVNKCKNSQHFYEPSSLIQVLDLLKSENIEPVIRRSALTQISVMMEDNLLHYTFLEQKGLELLLKIMENSLNEQDFNNYPDSVIPVICILKNVCFYNSSCRQDLSINPKIYSFILRGAFLFPEEKQFKQNCSCLMFLLLFGDFLTGSPLRADFSIPYLISYKFKVPFTCNYHWKTSDFFKNNIKDFVLSDIWYLNTLKVQFNSEFFGGFEQLLKKNELIYDESIEQFLRLEKYNLETLRASAVPFCVKQCLNDIQNGTSYKFILESIDKLNSYLILYKISQRNGENCILSYPWENTFSRFLKIPPINQDDVELLIGIINVLKLLLPFYKTNQCWFVDLLTNPNNSFLDLLNIVKLDESNHKYLIQDILLLITNCLNRNFDEKTQNWSHVIEVITENLTFFKSSPFYNLVELDAFLSCLVHLTANFGWISTNIAKKMTRNLCDLIIVFNIRKESTISLMGLNIIRNIILILNNILKELIYTKTKNWEVIFLDFEENCLKILLEMWNSRDAILRSAIVQLFAGWTLNAQLAIEIVNFTNIWELALKSFIDFKESCLVRENCVILLTNLTSHIKDNKIIVSIAPKSPLLNLLEKYQFFKNLKVLLNNSQNENELSITFSLVKSIVLFLSNLLELEFEEVTGKLQEFSLVKLFFKYLTIPKLTVNNRKNIADFYDILEMNSTICLLLGKITSNNQKCLEIVLSRKDCLVVLFSLLNNPNLPCFTDFRTKLWTEIFKLIVILTNSEEIDVIYSVLEETGYGQFFTTLCESLKQNVDSKLQVSSMVCLISILKKRRYFDENQKFLDSVKIASIEEMREEIDDNEELEILEEVYFGEITKRELVDEKSNIVGVEICRILLNLYNLDVIKKSLVVFCLTEVLFVSEEAKKFAVKYGFLQIIIKQLREFYVKLSLESVDCLRKINDKKRIVPLLKNLVDLIGMLTNFLCGNKQVKVEASNLGLSDLINKLWIWFNVQKSYLIVVLKMLNNFSVNCGEVGLFLTSSMGLKRNSTNSSLLHLIINLVTKEMEQISKTHDIIILELCFDILNNCCNIIECRLILSKTNFLQNANRLYCTTRKHKIWENVELLWLEFFHNFTIYSEGQSIAKMKEIFELIMTLTNSPMYNNKLLALLVLRNFAFYQPNKTRLTSSNEFLNILQLKLTNGSSEEKLIVVLIMWALAANNQRVKIILKSAQLDEKLQEILIQNQVNDAVFTNDELKRIGYVLSVIKDGERF